MFPGQYLSQSHSNWYAELYLDSDGDHLNFETLPGNHNHTTLWFMPKGQCHERYVEKLVTLKARHNSHGELPKNKSSLKLPRQ